MLKEIEQVVAHNAKAKARQSVKKNGMKGAGVFDEKDREKSDAHASAAMMQALAEAAKSGLDQEA